MANIFEFDARKGSLINPISGEVGVATDYNFVRREKGIALGDVGQSDRAYVLYSDIPTLTIGSGKSIELWVKILALGDAAFCCIGNDTYVNYEDNIGIRCNNSPRVFMVFYNGTVKSVANPNYELMEWNHVVAIYDEANSMMHIYINGVEVHSEAITAISDFSEYDEISVGSYLNGAYLEGNKEIGRVQIYDKALSAKERAKLYNEFLIASPTTRIVE